MKQYGLSNIVAIDDNELPQNNLENNACSIYGNNSTSKNSDSEKLQ